MTETSRGTFVLVGTPIGNRGDLSPRARAAILGADLLLCEDTRSPLRLLPDDADQLPQRVSCFVGNEHDRVGLLLDALAQGKRVAFVSEAGMPVWSDPGRFLVEAAWQAGAQLDAVPGPTAMGMALALSGFAAEGATFAGFLARSGPSRKTQLNAIAEGAGASVIYESGNRTRSLLTDLVQALGGQAVRRRVLVGRELTKAHQELIRGSCEAVLARVQGALRGEVCVVVEGAAPREDNCDEVPAERKSAREVFALMVDEGLKPRARAKAIAALTGDNAADIYRRLQRD